MKPSETSVVLIYTTDIFKRHLKHYSRIQHSGFPNSASRFSFSSTYLPLLLLNLLLYIVLNYQSLFLMTEPQFYLAKSANSTLTHLKMSPQRKQTKTYLRT